MTYPALQIPFPWAGEGPTLRMHFEGQVRHDPFLHGKAFAGTAHGMSLLTNTISNAWWVRSPPRTKNAF